MPPYCRAWEPDQHVTIPNVSVIIPTFNRAHLIGETLDSVFAQTRRADEIIVVDDGSTDDTENILATFAGRITYRRIPHAGASVARNIGLDLACSEYIAFLDSDDLWASRFLEQMTKTLDSAPDAGFAYSDYATFDAQGLRQAASLLAREKLNGNLFAQLLETDFISTGTLLIRRACFTRVGGFDSALAVAHDWDLWLRLARTFDARYVDEPLARIRIDSDGLTRNTPLIHADNLQILARLRHEVSDDKQLELVRQNARASHHALWVDNWRRRRALPMLRHFVFAFLA